MMKILLALCVVLAVASAGFNHMPEDIKIALEECVAEDGSMDMDEFKQLMAARDPKASCMFACAAEKIGVFDGEKFDIEKVHERASECSKNHGKEYSDEKRAKIQECVEQVNESGSDRCEKPFQMFKCFMGAAKTSE